METIQILSSKLREEELENERLRSERDAESEKALRAPDSTYDNVSPEAFKEQASLIARYQELDRKMGKYADWRRNQKGKVLADILKPEWTAAEPNGLLKRLVYKYRRWQGNAWKQEMCYTESRWSAFWSGIWAKMMKPASFLV